MYHGLILEVSAMREGRVNSLDSQTIRSLGRQGRSNLHPGQRSDGALD